MARGRDPVREDRDQLPRRPLPRRHNGLAQALTGPSQAFATWRRRALDALVLYVPHQDWYAMSTYFQGPTLQHLSRWTPQTVVSLGMVPGSAKGQFAGCAAGAFDFYYRQFGRLMIQDGAGQAVVRLGIE